MPKLTQRKLTNLDRVKISLTVLDGLKAKAVDIPASGKELHDIGTTFKFVRHGLENEVRALVAQLEGSAYILEELDLELGKLRSEIGAGKTTQSLKTKEVS